LLSYRRHRRLFQENPHPIIRLQQSLDLVAKILVVRADAVQKNHPLRGRQLNRFGKEFEVTTRAHISWSWMNGVSGSPSTSAIGPSLLSGQALSAPPPRTRPPWRERII